MIRDIPVYCVETFWPLVKPLLERALTHHPHLSTEGLLAVLMYGAGHLSVVLEGSEIVGAFVMEPSQYPTAYVPDEGQEYPTKKVGNVLACATNVGSWKTHGDSIIAHMEQWCRERKLDSIHMLGRAGWSRFVTRHGWRTQPSLVAWKELT